MCFEKPDTNIINGFYILLLNNTIVCYSCSNNLKFNLKLDNLSFKYEVVSYNIINIIMLYCNATCMFLFIYF